MYLLLRIGHEQILILVYATFLPSVTCDSIKFELIPNITRKMALIVTIHLSKFKIRPSTHAPFQLSSPLCVWTRDEVLFNKPLCEIQNQNLRVLDNDH